MTNADAHAPAEVIFRPVGDTALLVEFGQIISPETHDLVLALDAMLEARPFYGLVEVVPAYVNLLVVFDPWVTDHIEVEAALRSLLSGRDAPAIHSAAHEVQVCYDADFSPDLIEVARATGLSPDAVIDAHLGGDYSVYLYGFAPGYAYLAGVPDALHLPRKPMALRGIPAGSVLIAGTQCIVSTLTMPTGWWIIGRSPTRILRDDPKQPFLFAVGDRVHFCRISRALYDAAAAT